MIAFGIIDIIIGAKLAFFSLVLFTDSGNSVFPIVSLLLSLTLISVGIYLIRKNSKRKFLFSMFLSSFGLIYSILIIGYGIYIIVVSYINKDPRAGLLDVMKYIFGIPLLVIGTIFTVYFILHFIMFRKYFSK